MILQTKNLFKPSRLQDVMSHMLFFSVDQYELMDQWLMRVAASQATWVRT